MAIDAYVGLPRSGKSYTAVENVIVPALDAGRVVVTNLPLRPEKIAERWPHADVRPFDIPALVVLRDKWLAARRSKRTEHEAVEIEQQLQEALDVMAPKGAVLVIDEVWELWPDGARHVPVPFQELLAKHGHKVDSNNNAMSVCLVTQDLASVSAFARRLVDTTYRTIKLDDLGMPNTYRVEVYKGAVTGQAPPKKQLRNTSGGKYSPKVYDLYVSHTASDSNTAGANERRMDKRSIIWRSPKVLAIGCFVLLCLGWGLYAMLGYMDKAGDTKPAHVAAAGASEAPAAAPGVARFLGGKTPAAAVRELLVTGWIIGEGGLQSVAMLSDGAYQVTVPFDRFCQAWVEGWVTCNYLGEEYSSARRPIRRAAAVQAAAP